MKQKKNYLLFQGWSGNVGMGKINLFITTACLNMLKLQEFVFKGKWKEQWWY